MSEACNSCGAEIVFEAGKQSLTCPFCGTVNQITRPEDVLETSFDRIVPITVTPHELSNCLYAYMASGNFTPDDMLEASTITLREQYYVPAFAFRIDYKATWTASFGFDRQEARTVFRSVTSNGVTRQEPHTEYKTVTDWRPANGVDTGTFNVAGYAGTKLNKSPLAPADLVAHAVIHGSKTEYNPSFTKGFEVEEFSVPEKKVYDSLDDKISAIIDKRVKKHGQGDRQRDWHWNARMNHASTTYAVPICHGVFQYGDKEYHVWIGGHDVETIRADELPVDKDKQKVANIGFIPGALGIVTIIGSAYYWSFVWSSLLATGVALGYGFLRRKALIDYSKTIRSSLLLQKQASDQVANLSLEEQDKVAKAFQRPERPFLAQTHKDKIVLPVVAAAAFFGAVVPNAVFNPTAISQRYMARLAAEQDRRYAEALAVQEAAVREAAEEQTLRRAQEEASAALSVRQAAEQADQEQSDVEVLDAQEEVDHIAAETQASSRLQEEAVSAQKAAAEYIEGGKPVASSIQSPPTQDSSPVPTSSPGVSTTALAPAGVVSIAPRNQIAISSGFMVVAPQESRLLLTAMLQQATSAFKISEIKEKIEAIEKPINGDRKAARKMNEQGLAALRSEDFANAVSALKYATASDPSDVEVLNNYVYALIKSKRLHDAETEAGHLLTISPGRSSAWANLAEVYALKNKNEEAVAALVLAFQFSSNKDRTIRFLNERAVDSGSKLQAPAQAAINLIQRM